MKAIILFSIIQLTGTLLATAQQHSKDEAAIHETMAAFGKSWANHDFSDMNQYMTEDCHWINVVGMHWKNREEVQLAHQAFVSTMFANVKSTPVSEIFRFLSDDIAIVYKTVHMPAFYPPDGVDRGNNKRGDADNILTMVFVKRSNKWLYASAQNTTVIAEAAASNPVLKKQ